MKPTRPGIALTLIFILGGAIYELGVEKAAAWAFLVLLGCLLYRAFARRTA